MKNASILLTTVFVIAAGTIQAQMNFGIRAAININKVAATEALDAVSPEFKNITGWQIAGVSEFGFGDYFSVQPELAYTVKGFRVQENFNLELFNLPLPVGAEAISKFSYLEMPLLFKGKIGNEQVKAFAFAGPAVGYAVDGQLTTRAKAIFEFDLFDTDIDLDAINYERWELSGIVGGGLEIAVPNGKISLDARYQHGFTQLYDIPLLNEQIRNRGFTIGASYAMQF